LMQTRSQADEIAWTDREPAEFELVTTDDGLISFEFIEYEPTREEARLICRIKDLHDRGGTFRAIAEQLEKSKSTVARLYAQWDPTVAKLAATDVWGKPIIEKEIKPASFDSVGDTAGSDDFDELDDSDDFDPFDDADDPNGIAEVHEESAWPNGHLQHSAAGELAGTASEPPPRHEPPRQTTRLIEDLERAIDGYGCEIFIESREHHTARPLVWYKRRARTGVYARHERKMWSIAITDADPSGRLPMHENRNESSETDNLPLSLGP
jgi:hypothetical protein